MNIAGYVRLSRDEDRENYSSIISQKDIINEYLRKRDWQINRIYVDDNYSGYTFERPEFAEMLREVELGKIDIIIAKDLSRIGRNNGQVLVLIDKLRNLGIRLILVNEGNDGFDILEDDNDILGIKTWYNEMYVKDISRKIRASMELKQRTGELIMGNHYGYKKVKDNGGYKLIADDDIRPVIGLIFNEYVNGKGYKKICDILNGFGYPTPSEYQRKRIEKRGRVSKNNVSMEWQTHMIPRIIKDDLYIGTLRTKKKKSRYIKGKQAMVNRDEQYVFENHHEPMIEREIFELAQTINLKRKKINYRGNSKYDYIFSGFIICGDCGSPLCGKVIKSYPEKIRGYECTKYQKYGVKQCTSHKISEELLLSYFNEFLKDLMIKYSGFLQNISLKPKNANTINELVKLNRELKFIQDELRLIQNQRIKSILNEENNEYKDIINDSYDRLEKEKIINISKIQNRISEYTKTSKTDSIEDKKNLLGEFYSRRDNTAHYRGILEMILDKIIVYKNHRIEIRLLVDIDKIINQ